MPDDTAPVIPENFEDNEHWQRDADTLFAAARIFAEGYADIPDVARFLREPGCRDAFHAGIMAGIVTAGETLRTAGWMREEPLVPLPPDIVAAAEACQRADKERGYTE